MATANYILKDKNAQFETRIICLLTDGRKNRLKIYTDYSVHPKSWSDTKKQVKQSDKSYQLKNEYLHGSVNQQSFKDRVRAIYDEAKAQGLNPTTRYINQKLTPNKKSNGYAGFWEVWEIYLDDKKGRFTKASFKKFKSLKVHLEGFEKKSSIPFWDFEIISKSRLEKFQSYLYESGINNQTAAKYIGVFKMFLNWAVENDFTTVTDYKSFKPIYQKDTLKVALTPEEVEAVRQADLKGKGYLENVRKLFILSTLTGLRYSDYSRIRKEHLKKDDDGTVLLQIRQQKTGDIVELPLTPEAESIIRELISGKVHPISNQKMNTFVKELCEKAKINEQFEVHRFIGKLVKTTYKPKYDLITTHTGRRTFATNLLLKGIPAQTVMMFTGHRDYKSFAKYVNIPKKTQIQSVKMALMA